MLSRINTILFIGLVAFGCGESVESTDPTGVSTTYIIFNEDLNPIGEVIINELENKSFTTEIELSDVFAENVDIDLFDDNSIDIGSLETTVGIMNSGSASESFEKLGSISLSYQEVLDYDGHISFSINGNRVAHADIGENELLDIVEEYPLYEVDIPGISGIAIFQSRKNLETVVTVNLENTQAGAIHPAHIHNSTRIAGGGVAISLTSIDGTSGRSITNIDKEDNGTALNSNQMFDFNGYIAIHNSSSDFSTFVVQGDIGRNSFTGRETVYEARSTSEDGISGSIIFKERKSTNTLVITELVDDLPGIDHVVHIHQNTAAEGGSVVIDLSTFNGIGYTDVSEDNSGGILSYDDLINYNGYVNIHYSQANFGVNLAQADIGINALTGVKEIYPILDLDVSGISGQAIFEQRVNNETLVTLEIDGTSGINRACHIHENSALMGGNIVIDLNQIDGASGISRSNISQYNDGASINYDELVGFDGHIAIHVNPSGGAILAKGDIGSNAN